MYSKVNIHVFPCPPGHRLENTSGSMTCKCPKVGGDCFTGYVVCQQDSESLIFVGYCISYSEIEIKGKPSKEVIVSKCPFFSGLEVSEPTISLPMNVSELDDRFCTNQWNRTGSKWLHLFQPVHYNSTAGTANRSSMGISTAT